MNNLAAALIILVVTSCGHPCTSHRMLSEQARESVKTKIKTPTTATFSDEVIEPAKTGGGLLVKGMITAQNSFGAMISEKYVVHITCIEDKPVIVWASMGAAHWGTESEELDRRTAAAMDSISAAFDARMDSIDRAYAHPR